MLLEAKDYEYFDFVNIIIKSDVQLTVYRDEFL